MTKLKIKEKFTQSEETDIEVSSLKDGDMLYSYNFDTMLMIVEDYGILHVIDLTDATLIDPDDEFETVFNSYNDRFGPFCMVDKAKITFTVGG